MNRRDFISLYVIHNPGALSERMRQAIEAWDAVSKEAPTPKTEKVREAMDNLTEEEKAKVSKLWMLWQTFTGVPKERSDKGAVARAVIKHRRLDFDEVMVGAKNYLAHMANHGRMQYVPGLQVWLNKKSWLEWQGEEQKEREVNTEQMRLRQDLSHAKRMLEADPDNEGWQKQVKELTEKMRV